MKTIDACRAEASEARRRVTAGMAGTSNERDVIADDTV
jgi:hypothetical protein